MKSNGEVRKLDDFGRVAIPKCIRAQLQLHEGDPVVIALTGENSIHIQKYRPIEGIVEETTVALVNAFRTTFNVDVFITNEVGNVIQSTVRHFRGLKLDDEILDFCKRGTMSQLTGYIKDSTGQYSYAISGYAPIAFKNQYNEERIEGFVFVYENDKKLVGQQLAQTIAAVISEKLQAYF